MSEAKMKAADSSAKKQNWILKKSVLNLGGGLDVEHSKDTIHNHTSLNGRFK